MQFQYPVLEKQQQYQPVPAAQQPKQVATKQKCQVVYKQVAVPVQQQPQQTVQQHFVQVQPMVVPVAPTPAIQRVIARPLYLDEKIAKTNEAVNYEAKRVYICSWIFLVFGVTCVLTGFNELFDARRKAAFIAKEHQIPWGNKNFTNFTMANATSPTIDRVEIELHDGIRNMSILTVVVSALIFMMGSSANRSATKLKSKVSQRMFGRHFFYFLAFLVFYVFTRKQSRTFKGIFDKLKEGDKNVTSMNPTDMTPKRKLREMYVDLDNMYQRHSQQVPDEVKMIMEDMRYAGDEVMTNMTADLDRMFQRHPIPDEVKEMMQNIHGFHKHLQNQKAWQESHEIEEDEIEGEEEQWDGRREAYRMFAPGLYEQAMRKERQQARYGGRHHGPKVRADKKSKKDAVKDWPKMHAMCPVMLFFIGASIYQICRIKFLEKALAKLEFLQKAKKLVKSKTAEKKQAKVVAPVQQVQQTLTTFAPQQVQMAPAPQQVAPKNIKLMQQVMMPVTAQKPVMMKKIEDVEAIPQVNESFDYSMSDPLVDGLSEIASSEPDDISQTGFVSSKNSML